MKNLKVTKKEIETKRRFEFTAPYSLGRGDIGKVRTEITINYTTKKFHFLDGGRYYLENSKGSPIIARFKKGDKLDAAFKKLFGVATYFAKGELKKSVIHIK